MNKSFLVVSFADAQEKSVLEFASRLAPLGYVYCLSTEWEEVEDTSSGVRLLPLTEDRLPDIHELQGIYVFGSAEQLIPIRKRYPDVRVFHRAPAREPSRHPLRTTSPVAASDSRWAAA